MTPIAFTDLKKINHQDHRLSPLIEGAIRRVLDRGKYILGEEVSLFEKEFAKYCEVSGAIGVASGTEAIYLSLLALGVGNDDLVITVPNTAVPTVSAIVMSGATPILADIERDTGNLDVEKLKKYLQQLPSNELSKIRAIIPVHLYGHPVDMDYLSEVVSPYNISIIEDASHAHGSRYKGRMVGSIGALGCFSFYPTKNLGALGDAGIVVSNDQKLIERLRMLRNYGEEKRYHNRIHGVNSRLDELQAAILREKLPFLEEWNQRRRQLASIYNEHLSSKHFLSNFIQLPIEKTYSHHVYHLYVIKVIKVPGTFRDPFRDHLRQWLLDRGIQTDIHYPLPINMQPGYQNVQCSSQHIGEEHARSILSLPISPEHSNQEIIHVANAIVDFFGDFFVDRGKSALNGF